MRVLARVALVVILVTALDPAAGATMLVRPLSLREVVAEAPRIIHARVVEVRSGRDEARLPVTWVTLDVLQGLKGVSGSRLVVKQLGAAEPLADGALARVAGLPSYAVGEELVLFLRDDSRRGFTSPVGFGQGVYRVRRAGGRALVRRDLPHGTGDPLPGEEPLDRFLSTVARLTRWRR